MSQYKVSVDLAPLLAANAALAQEAFPLISQAVKAVAEEGAFRWKQAVMHARLWEGEKVPYVESIKWRMVGPMAAEISSDFKPALQIENGRPARDLKRMLQTSKKVRLAKEGPHKGQRYLIIPFRHNTPTPSGQGALAPQMPSAVYAQAKRLSPSTITGSTLRVSGQASPALAGRWGALAASRSARGAGPGASTYLIHQNVYQWGGRLPAGMGEKRHPNNVTDPYAGMVRFKTSTPGARSSAYLTFRVMGEWSSGWVVGAKPGLYLLKNVAQGLQPVFEQAVGQAVTLKSLRR